MMPGKVDKPTQIKAFLGTSEQEKFMIMHTFADWGRVRHNKAESLGITTV